MFDTNTDDNKPKQKLQIKAKFTLSDGVTSVKAMVPESNFAKLVSKIYKGTPYFLNVQNSD
jgi:hypothetical protein